MESKRALQKKQTRAKIKGAAYQIYSERGFGVTTAELAQFTGVSHGTIFVHFPTLDKLLEEIIRDFGNTLITEMHDLSEQKGMIKELLAAYVNILSNHEAFYIQLICQRSLLPESAQLTVANIQSTAAFHFNRVLERETEKNTVKDLPVHMLFNTWLGLLHYYLCNKDFFAPSEPLLRRYGTQLIETYLTLIKK